MDELSLLVVALRQSRDRLEGTLAAIARDPGWSREVLARRGRPGGPHIGWHLAHVACIEDLWAHEYFASGEPRRPDLVRRFFRGTTATEEVPGAAELLEYLELARRDLIASAE